MKNFPNQISKFDRIRAGLALIKDLSDAGFDVASSDVVGYAAARRGIYTFRSLPFEAATKEQIEAAIQEAKTKAAQDQGPLTFARDLRRTLVYLGWLDAQTSLTDAGEELLASNPGSVEEQGLLVEGLMNIEVTEKDGSYPHHPTPVLLKLLADNPSYRREGLELAFQPKDDSDAEFKKVLKLYPLSREERIRRLNTTTSQRSNAVKILPSLCVAAGLVVEDDEHYFSLSQEGWSILRRQASSNAPAKVRKAIVERGRRTTVGKLVTSKTIAKRKSNHPPRSLTPEEQARAAEKLKERTEAHQALVSRTAGSIGDIGGRFFEDEFSFDMLWIPADDKVPALLFEMKTITGITDAHARVRSAVGQLSYYEYFHAGPRLDGREVQRVIVVDADLPDELKQYQTYESLAAVSYVKGKSMVGLNPLGVEVLAMLPQKPVESGPVGRIQR